MFGTSADVNARPPRYLTHMELVEVRVSCPSEAIAEEIGRAAVEARLAACAHVSPIWSVYRWEGAVHQESEWSVSLKSRADLFEQLSVLIREAHPYDLPAIMSHRCGADGATQTWIVEVTS